MFTLDDVLKDIAGYNPHLASELAKLPELCGAVRTLSLQGLQHLLGLYRLVPGAFDVFFQNCTGIGLPKSRSYCAPLQAILWLAEDGLFDAIGRALCIELTTDKQPDGTIGFYKLSDRESTPEDPLDALLDDAWGREPSLFSDKRLRAIVSRICTDAGVEEYALLVKKYDAGQLQKYIFQDFQKKREIFAEKDWPAINTALDSARWERFEKVAMRLNSAPLIHYYIARNIRYRRSAANGPYFTFFLGQGQCTDVAFFAKALLEQAGYRTFIRSIKWNRDPWDGLHTASGIISKDGAYTVVGNFTGINRYCGPFKTVDDLDLALAGDRAIIDRRWGAYYPPRYF